MMTAAGRLLEGSVKGKEGMAAALEEVLSAYPKPPEAERRPDWVDREVKPPCSPPPGRLVQTIYDLVPPGPRSRSAEAGGPSPC